MVTTRKRYKSWDADSENTRVRLGAARLNLKRARMALSQAQVEADRTSRLLRNAEKKAEEFRGDRMFAQRKLEEAQRSSNEARRKGSARHRWEADVRRFQGQMDRAEDDLRRWVDNGRGQEKTVKGLDLEIRDRQTDVETRMEEVRKLNLRYQHLARLGRGMRLRTGRTSEKRSVATDTNHSLTITEPAIYALKQVLESLEHEHDQALRLSMDSNNAVILSLDTVRPGDNAVNHEGMPVLLVDHEMPLGLRGKTMDVSESYEGTQIVVSD